METLHSRQDTMLAVNVSGHHTGTVEGSLVKFTGNKVDKRVIAVQVFISMLCQTTGFFNVFILFFLQGTTAFHYL